MTQVADASSHADASVHTERQARKVIEATRETEWRKPSFGKELFLGRLPARPDRPVAGRHDAESVAKAEEFLRQARRRTLAAHVDGAQIERDARIPDEVLRGLAELGAFGMKIDEKYGGLGLSNLDYCRALMLRRLGQPVGRRAAVGAPVDRRAAAAEAVRHRGAEGAGSCPGWPPARSPRSC